MKPWGYISQAHEELLANSVVNRLDAFERDIENVRKQIWYQWDDDNLPSKIEAYLLIKANLLVGLMSKDDQRQRVYSLVSYPLEHVALLERRFVYDETQGAHRSRFKGAALTLHFTAASGIQSITIPGPPKDDDVEEHREFCAALCQQVG
jgi:hypothetical protein